MARPWQTLESLQTPAGALELRRRGARDFLIVLGSRVLMTSAARRSEQRLAECACAGLRDVSGVRLLIGGLGMGYTLRAALDALAPDARVEVAEIEPAVVRWCAGPLASLTDGAAADPRVEVRVADVAERIGAAPPGVLHAIALDLFEGPRGGRAEAGHPLYGDAALASCARALAPGGVLAIWSEAPAKGFERRLRATGFAVRVEWAGRGGRRHPLYLARRRVTG